MAGESRRRRLRALLDRAGVPADALEAIDAAFVHESAAKEQLLLSNERLEFLGDAVLGLVVARWLYATYGDEKEGVLAKRKAAIVSDYAIAQTARGLGFADLLLVGAGERAHGGTHRTSILADAFEAFIATLYLHYGLEAAQQFVEREHIAPFDHEVAAIADAKTQLQELTQARLGCTPVYDEQGEGPAHERIFTSMVRVNGEMLGKGTGPSKKAAQQNAAAEALTTLRTRLLCD
ncbi:MAG TPA: ribonuclease III [Candidatus Baltobacteraceae bacterium]|jgi:ribonuclease-3|nr:ribonuclease III [Candidatus Baltobacteraceae bacterium]